MCCYRVTHNIKSRSDITDAPIPIINHNDLVFINGEIAYEKQRNGDKFVSVPHILAKKVVHMENNNHNSDDLEQLFTGKNAMFSLSYVCIS